MINEIISFAAFTACFATVSCASSYYWHRKLKKEDEGFSERLEKYIMGSNDDMRDLVNSLQTEYSKKILSYQSVHSEMYIAVQDQIEDLKEKYNVSMTSIKEYMDEVNVFLEDVTEELKDHDTDIQRLFDSFAEMKESVKSMEESMEQEDKLFIIKDKPRR